MKKSLLLGSIAMAACGHASPAPAPAPANSGTAAQDPGVPIRCQPNGNIVATGPTSEDVPVVVLYERSAWQSGVDLPTLLVWADGTVVYGDVPYGKSFRLFQATLSPESAAEVQQAVVARLRAAPPHTGMTNMTDQPTVEIMFRDDDAWRVVEAYGMTRTTKEDEVPSPLRDVFAAYRDLLNRRPSGRTPAPTGYPRPDRWPEQLPTFRGQHAVDALSLCAFRRSLGNG
jgi:hypothetical protein